MSYYRSLSKMIMFRVLVYISNCLLDICFFLLLSAATVVYCVRVVAVDGAAGCICILVRHIARGLLLLDASSASCQAVRRMAAAGGGQPAPPVRPQRPRLGAGRPSYGRMGGHRLAYILWSNWNSLPTLSTTVPPVVCIIDYLIVCCFNFFFRCHSILWGSMVRGNRICGYITYLGG